MLSSINSHLFKLSGPHMPQVNWGKRNGIVQFCKSGGGTDSHTTLTHNFQLLQVFFFFFFFFLKQVKQVFCGKVWNKLKVGQ